MTHVSHTHFGVNLLYNQQDEHGQDLVEKGQVLDLVNVYRDYGFRYLRWPGGSVTENDACEDPKQFFKPDNKIGLDELLGICREYGFRAHIVVPTRVWRDNNSGMSHWLQKLREADQSLIATIELGNEYWGKDKNTGIALSPVEYGLVARKLLPKLRDAAPGVPVFIQNAPHWTNHQSHAIYDQLAKASTPVLTGAVDHWYPQTWSGNTSPGRMFAAMREKPAHLPPGAPWELNVSEWNISLDNNKNGIYGLELGLFLAAMLWRMVAEDVKWASLWGFHYRHLANKLRGYRYNGTAYDTAAGTMFRTFQSLIGYEPVESPTWAGSRAVTFRKGTQHVTYFTGQAAPVSVSIQASFEFEPFDDPATPNQDETVPGTTQQARLRTNYIYKPGGYYRIDYEPVSATRSPGGGLLGWLKNLFA